MYRVEADAAGQPRLVSDAVLSPDEFEAIARAIGLAARRARKTGRISAREARGGERIETRWNGKETAATASAGDWIATSLTPSGTPMRDADGHENIYVVPGPRFAELYEPDADHSGIFHPRGVVRALPLSGGFAIRAPWGEMQTAADGYLILNGADVYGNHAETFRATYEFLDD